MDRKQLNTALWSAQWTLAVAFDFTGMCKLGLEADHVRAHFTLTADAASPVLHTVGAVEVALAVLIILPALLVPALSILASLALSAVALVGILQPATAMATGFAAVDVALLLVAALVTAGRIAQAMTAVGPDWRSCSILLEGRDVRQVLRPARRALVADQIVLADQGHFLPFEVDHEAARAWPPTTR